MYKKYKHVLKYADEDIIQAISADQTQSENVDKLLFQCNEAIKGLSNEVEALNKYSTRVRCPACKIRSVFHMDSDRLTLPYEYIKGLSVCQVYIRMASGLRKSLKEYESEIIRFVTQELKKDPISLKDNEQKKKIPVQENRCCPFCYKKFVSVYTYYKHSQKCRTAYVTSIVAVPDDYKLPIPFETSHIDPNTIYSRNTESPCQIIRYVISQMFLNPNNRCVETRPGPTSRLLKVHNGYNRWTNRPYKEVQLQIILSVCVQLMPIANAYIEKLTEEEEKSDTAMAMRSTLIVAAKIIEKIKNEELGEVHKRYKKVFIEEIMKELRGSPEAPVGAAIETETSCSTPVTQQ